MLGLFLVTQWGQDRFLTQIETMRLCLSRSVKQSGKFQTCSKQHQATVSGDILWINIFDKKNEFMLLCSKISFSFWISLCPLFSLVSILIMGSIMASWYTQILCGSAYIHPPPQLPSIVPPPRQLVIFPPLLLGVDLPTPVNLRSSWI